jgi:UDP-galactopyranose mutase
MVPYNAKLWTIPPSELTTDWQSVYVPKVTIEEIIDGALFDNADRVGYNASFFYPMKGGIESLVCAIYERLDKDRLFTDCEAHEVDQDKKMVTTDNGLKIYYRNLVTTAPLKFFVGLLSSVPEKIKEFNERLKYISVYNLNLAVQGERFKDKDWIYLPEPELNCYRIGFPTNFSSFIAPAGYTTAYTEISYSDRKPLKKNGAREKIIGDLMKIGLISDLDNIVHEKLFDINVGYVLYDANRNEAVGSIMLYLNTNGIYSIGRFGAWEYSAMEDAILEGKDTAEMLNETGG